jgi:CheY-like chemotaxis protein
MTDKKILVVDDEEVIINLLTRAFERAGYTVRSAQSAEDALELLQHEEINIMFFDLNLPGMDGIELCKEVKKNIPMSLIYAVTGYASQFELMDCRDAGFEDYFKKPMNMKTLIKTAADSFEKLERWKKV